ncbi:MAG: ABC-F family ATP-binding cassette domain-containing protein [Magnetococcales bacterium]|nr:ABC-F family ATP-binding cassette domain-containing protein [Magnetococcales bacterium]
MLTIEKITKNLGGRRVLDQADLVVHPGERVGLIGPNGAGKTTLLRLIAQETDADEGAIRMRGGVRIGLLRQEILDGEYTLLATTLAGDEELMTLRDERARIEADLLEERPGPHHEELAARMGEIDLRLTTLESHSAEGRAAVILMGLGFAPQDLERPLANFSGGWRMRAQLARLLFSRADLLLLDEPTNHLDLESAAWLENRIRKSPGGLAMILVSHDRSFLNRTTNITVELEAGRLSRFAGPFDAWLEQKNALMESLEKNAARQGKRREELECFIRRFRAKATKARQVQSRVKMLEKMAPVATVTKGPPPPRIRFPVPPACAREVLAIRRLTKGYDGRELFSGVNLTLERGEKVGVVGINGAGKSTLLKLIAGEAVADAGEVIPGERVKVARFAQHALESLNPDKTVLESAAEAAPDQFGLTALRTLLGGLLFSGEAVETRVANLSGGERVRLALARMFLSGANLLLLDEPANHLDMAARAALEEALTDYPGAVLLVTHDRDLMEAACDRLWVVAGGKVVAWEGGLEDYLANVIREERAFASPANTEGGGTRDARELRRLSAQTRDRMRRETAGQRARLEKLEKSIALLEGEQQDLQAGLADPDAYAAASREGLKEKLTRAGQVEQALHAAMEEWEALSLALAACEAAVEEELARLRA